MQLPWEGDRQFPKNKIMLGGGYGGLERGGHGEWSRMSSSHLLEGTVPVAGPAASSLRLKSVEGTDFTLSVLMPLQVNI